MDYNDRGRVWRAGPPSEEYNPAALLLVEQGSVDFLCVSKAIKGL